MQSLRLFPSDWGSQQESCQTALSRWRSCWRCVPMSGCSTRSRRTSGFRTWSRSFCVTTAAAVTSRTCSALSDGDHCWCHFTFVIMLVFAFNNPDKDLVIKVTKLWCCFSFLCAPFPDVAFAKFLFYVSFCFVFDLSLKNIFTCLVWLVVLFFFCLFVLFCFCLFFWNCNLSISKYCFWLLHCDPI